MFSPTDIDRVTANVFLRSLSAPLLDVSLFAIFGLSDKKQIKIKKEEEEE